MVSNSNAAGTVLQIGNIALSLEACCEACTKLPSCNVYNFCANPDGWWVAGVVCEPATADGVQSS